MKRLFTFMLLALFIIIFSTQCSKNPTSQEPLNLSDNSQNDFSLEQIQSLSSDIDSIEEQCVSDTAVNPKKRLAIALIKLDNLLGFTGKIVLHADIEEATDLYEQARDSQHNAIESAQSDSIDLAFSYIKESKYLALEAIKTVYQQIGPPPVIERIRQFQEEAKALIEQIKPLLEESDKTLAFICFHKGMIHLRLARESLDKFELRKAEFHIRTALFWFRRSYGILT